MPLDGMNFMSDNIPDALPLISQSAANGMRLATLEEVSRKHSDDLTVVRHTLHELNGKMQLFIIAEQTCGKNLDALTAMLKEHTDTIKGLVSSRDQAYGIWWAIVRVCTISVTGFGIVGMIIAAIGWAIEHNFYIGMK